MGLEQQLFGYFTPRARKRGDDYFNRRRVTVHEGDAWNLRASVRGSQQYEVDLTRDQAHHIAAWCTCPVVERFVLCKHIWAALRTADERGLLNGNGNARATLDLDDVRLDRLVYGNDGHVRGPGGDPRIDAFDPLEDVRFDAPARSRPPHAPARGARPPSVVPGRQHPSTWRDLLAQLPAAVDADSSTRWMAPTHGRREIVYIIDARLTGAAGGLFIEIAWRDRKTNGDWGTVKTRNYLGAELVSAVTPDDETTLWRLWAISQGGFYDREDIPLERALSSQRNQVLVPGPLVPFVLPDMCRTGRCRLRTSPKEVRDAPLQWDDAPPWTLHLEVRAGASTPPEAYVLDYELRRGDLRLSKDDALVLTADGYVLTETHIARFDPAGSFGWVALLHDSGSLTVPSPDADALLSAIVARPGSAPLALDAGLGVTEQRVAPVPRLMMRVGEGRPRSGAEDLTADVSFLYDQAEIAWNHPTERVFLADTRTIVARDRDAERRALGELPAAGVRSRSDHAWGEAPWKLSAAALPAAVRYLSDRGWRVEASGRVFRRARSSRTWVRSGIDWFDLEGRVDFGDVSASMGEVVAAITRGEQVVRLSDGSAGLLPEEWLSRFGRWAALGQTHDEGIRFTRSQAALLDALLTAAPEVDVDARFAHARAELNTADRVAPCDPPAGFEGQLRAYQREGLGWIRFLERLGFGGCLADDMGLGKTVQVLAALAGRRAADPTLDPSLVVVPRSLVFNWLREAARFAPSLRLLDHTGAGRTRTLSAFDAVDLVVTTYGTLRQDAPQLADRSFDYVVLDEAHAIKNVDSQTAKAVRLLKGRNRLALTGTPVQNHLGDLWSLFEFLNPGVLGRSTVFSRLIDKTSLDATARDLVARAVRPFVLRRTKGAVARDLPPRVEDTIVCRLDADERRFYDELRTRYRHLLGARIEREGWAKSRMLVLEALLRLRQAACHPGLVDRQWKHESSAKLDVLVSQLREVRDEGHKAVVFSQFVMLLDRVRVLLDRDGMVYEYLDGSTRNRETHVDRFQHDASCPLFLVSLKAGGLGLNLTAAEYVFLLDPWWNPAIEAQAIDRAHRIGQTRQVFAYRLIAEDTIEEKVLELQARKRELAEAILAEDAGTLQGLTRDDLDLLLS